MKRRIRLTEGRLRKLVESALNELDWKTYMNAAKKQYDIAAKEWQQGKQDRDNFNKFRRASRFADKGECAFADKYGTNGYDTLYMSPEETQYACPNDDDEDSWDAYYFGHDGDWYTTTTDGGDYIDHEYKDGYKHDDPALRALGDYYGKKSKYTKGKGWENESRRRMVNAITEAVVRRLKRR